MKFKMIIYQSLCLFLFNIIQRYLLKSSTSVSSNDRTRVPYHDFHILLKLFNSERVSFFCGSSHYSTKIVEECEIREAKGPPLINTVNIIMAVLYNLNIHFIVGLGHLCAILGAIHMPSYRVKYFENSEYPFILFVSEKSSGTHQDLLCTGVLISKRHVLISAECIQDKQTRDLKVIGGSKEHLFSTSTTYDVASSITYKNWSSSLPDEIPIFSHHDLAILQLKEKIRGIAPAAISVRNDSRSSGQDLNAMGWLEYRHPNAREFIRRPQEVPMIMLSSTECILESSDSDDLINVNLLLDTLCAETKSRVPLVTARDQIGPVLDSPSSVLGIVTERYKLSSHKEVELILCLDDFTEFISNVTNNTVSYAY